MTGIASNGGVGFRVVAEVPAANFQPAAGNWPTALKSYGAYLGAPGWHPDACAINIGIDNAPGIGPVSHWDLHKPQVFSEMTNWLVRAGYGKYPVNQHGNCNPFSIPAGGGGGGSPSPHIPNLEIPE